MALVLAVMAPGIVPFGIDVLNQRFFYAHDDGRMVFYEQVVLSIVASGIALLALGVRPETTVAVVSVGLVLTSAAPRSACGSSGGGSGRSGSARSPSVGPDGRRGPRRRGGAYLATTPLRDGPTGRVGPSPSSLSGAWCSGWSTSRSPC